MCYTSKGNRFPGLGALEKKLIMATGSGIRLDGHIVSSTYYVFDMDIFAPQSTRLAGVQAALHEIDGVQPLDYKMCNTYEEVLEANEQYKGQGFKGSIVRDPEAPYFTGANYAWMELK